MLKKLYLLFIVSLIPVYVAPAAVPPLPHQIIHTFLARYKRPFTFFELSNKKFTTTYTACFHSIYKKSIFVLLNPFIKYKELPTAKNLVCLSRTVNTAAPLQRMSEVENFDITFAGNIVEKFGCEWQDALSALLNMGEHLILEVSSPSDRENEQKLIHFIKNHPIKNIVASSGTSENISIYYVHITAPQSVKRNHFLETPRYTNPHQIESDFDKKILIKRIVKCNKIVESSWHPGINLVTFKMMEGIFPSLQTVWQEINKLTTIPHNDWQPHNMVIKGSKVTLIDFDSWSEIKPKISENQQSPLFLSNFYTWLTMKKWNDIRESFWTMLCPSSGKVKAMKEGII